MRLLHTSDWHVGKTLRGRSRIEEHRAVLAELAAVAEAEGVDAVLVGGDVFDSATPSPEAEQVAYEGLLALSAERTRPVVVIGGNHDSALRLAAVAPVFAAHGVRILAAPARPDDGGVLDVETPAGAARLALLPFPSQKVVVSAGQLMAGAAFEHAQTYSARVRAVLDVLGTGFERSGTVNIVLAHLMVLGGTMGGGERAAHTVLDYAVHASAFPTSAHYVALGHLHRTQQVDGPCPIRYCGSPLQLDFGETANEPGALVVEATPGRPGVDVRAVPLAAGRRLRVLRGTPEELLVLGAAGEGEAEHLRLVVDSGPRPGLADELRARFPTAVEVVLAPRDDARPSAGAAAGEPTRAGRAPGELFRAYLEHAGAPDDAVVALFDELAGELQEPSR